MSADYNQCQCDRQRLRGLRACLAHVSHMTSAMTAAPILDHLLLGNSRNEDFSMPISTDKISLGVRRALQQCAQADGTFAMLAMDQRGSLIRAINPNDPASVRYAQVVALKRDVIGALSPHASATLLDVEYGYPACVASGALSGRSRGCCWPTRRAATRATRRRGAPRCWTTGTPAAAGGRRNRRQAARLLSPGCGQRR